MPVAARPEASPGPNPGPHAADTQSAWTEQAPVAHRDVPRVFPPEAGIPQTARTPLARLSFQPCALLRRPAPRSWVAAPHLRDDLNPRPWPGTASSGKGIPSPPPAETDSGLWPPPPTQGPAKGGLGLLAPGAASLGDRRPPPLGLPRKRAPEAAARHPRLKNEAMRPPLETSANFVSG